MSHSETKYSFCPDTVIAAMTRSGPKSLTVEDAYAMGFRHVLDLTKINRVAELYRDDQSDAYALKILEAWRRGAMTAKEMLENESVTLQ